MNRTLFGDCRDTMRELIAQGVTVQCCVTSPPYFGLRDYGHPGQVGLESTPAKYVAAMVEVFDLVRALLRDDGVLWLNLGDSYATGGGGVGNCPYEGKQGESWKLRGVMTPPNRLPLPGLKPKDLIGAPWRVAFALQESGWYLRQDIIWHKPNPMPESVRDRCTKAHEYLFLLSKSERYYWDADAMQESAEYLGPNGRQQSPYAQGFARRSPDEELERRARKSGNKERKPASARGVPVDTNGRSTGAVAGSVPWEGVTRNRRSVWTIPTKPYAGAHFATFPPSLIEPCILAGSRSGDVVLDPFIGSGTTAEVAQRLGRKWIGCELNEEYGRLQQERTAQSALSI